MIGPLLIINMSKKPSPIQAISIDARKGIWVSAIFSSKTLLGYGLLPKRYVDSNWLTLCKETDDRKINEMERLFATHIRKIYIMERTMDLLQQTAEKQIEK